MIAVPTKGAEHGVDIIVVRNPLKKSPIKPWWFFGIKSNNILGNLISNKPSILNPNNKMTRVIKSKKEEFWNCIPQLIEWPKCFKLINAIASVDKNLISNIKVFDVYEGNNIPENQKSIAISVTIQSIDKTLNDNDLENINKLIIETVENKTGAKIRS